MIHTALFLLALSLYLGALTQIAFVIWNADVWRGWAAFAFGGLGFAAGGYANLVWLANPLAFMAWYCHSKPVPTVALATASLLLAVSFKFCSTVVVSEAGGPGYAITAVGLGYWLWLAAIAITLLASLTVIF